MKTRQGFVSNSSTSSFIIIGCPLDDESIEEDDYDYKTGKGVHHIDSIGYVQGVKLARGEELPDKKIPWSILAEMAKEAADSAGVDISQVCLYCGSKYG